MTFYFLLAGQVLLTVASQDSPVVLVQTFVQASALAHPDAPDHALPVPLGSWWKGAEPRAAARSTSMPPSRPHGREAAKAKELPQQPAGIPFSEMWLGVAAWDVSGSAQTAHMYLARILSIVLFIVGLSMLYVVTTKPGENSESLRKAAALFEDPALSKSDGAGQCGQYYRGSGGAGSLLAAGLEPADSPGHKAGGVVSEPEVLPEPDMSGFWLLTKVEGDMHSFMVDLGMGPLSRLAHSTANYGVGRTVKHIVQVGNAFQISIISILPWRPQTVKSKFLVGAGDQGSAEPYGKTVSICPRWDRQTLAIDRRDNDGNMVKFQRWDLQGPAVMVLDVRSSRGTLARLTYHRKLHLGAYWERRLHDLARSFPLDRPLLKSFPRPDQEDLSSCSP
jgi:hypothetical protein